MTTQQTVRTWFRDGTELQGSPGVFSNCGFETVEFPNPDPCGCGESDCDDCQGEDDSTVLVAVPVSWGTIKQIYTKIVDHFAAGQVKS